MKRGYADTPLGQLHYRYAGAGEPIVLLGSAGRSSRMFADLVAALSDRFTAFAVDVLGSGGSDPLPDGADMPLMATSIVQFLDAVGLPTASVFGLHTGNKIGSALAAASPNRVSHFVLCGQTHSIVPDLASRNSGIGDRAKTYGGGLDEQNSSLVAWSMLSQRMSDLWWRGEGFGDGEFDTAITQAKIKALDELESFEAVPTMYAMNFGYDMAQDWPRISVPTVVLEITTPREDALYGRQGELVAALIPGARVATMASSGYKHTFEDRAGELAEIITGFCG